MKSAVYLNNTDVCFTRRLSNERYYDFIDRHPDIYSVDGAIINNIKVKYINTMKDEESDSHVYIEKLAKMKTAITEKLDETLIGDNGFTFDIDKLDFVEINRDRFDDTLNAYRYTYLYNLCINASVNDTPIGEIYIPFIVVESIDGNTEYALIYPFANQLANMTPDEMIEIFPVDSSLILNIVRCIQTSLTPQDHIYISLMNGIKKYKYSYRSTTDEGLKKVVSLLGFDGRLLENYGDCVYDLPIISIDTDNRKITRVLCTDLSEYKAVSHEEYLADPNLYAIIARYDDVVGNTSIIPLDSDKVFPLGSKLVELESTVVETEDSGYEEVSLYKPSAESDQDIFGMVYVGPDWSQSIPRGEYSDALSSKELSNLEKVSAPAVATFNGIMKTGKEILKGIKNTKMNLTYAGYLNDYLDKIFNFLQVVVPTTALFILIGPITGLLFAILGLMYKLNRDKAEAEEKAISNVEEHYSKKIEELEALKETYEAQNHKRAALRVQQVLDKFENRMNNIRNAKELKG